LKAVVARLLSLSLFADSAAAAFILMNEETALLAVLLLHIILFKHTNPNRVNWMKLDAYGS